MTYYQIARIVNTFGIKGELKVLSDSDFIEERFTPGNELYILNQKKLVQTVTVESYRPVKGSYIVKFKEFYNINQVEQFKGLQLGIREDQQKALEEDAFYYHEIMGLKVETTQGDYLGTIKDILELGSNDVWVVKRPEPGKKDALIPYISDVVKSVDLDQALVQVELMEGLIDDED